MNTPITAQGRSMPTGPLVSVAPLMQRMASHGMVCLPLSHHLNIKKRAPTINAVFTMSTRQLMPARCTSKAVSDSKVASNAMFAFLRLAKNTKPPTLMATSANADGRRDVNSLTWP